MDMKVGIYMNIGNNTKLN